MGGESFGVNRRVSVRSLIKSHETDGGRGERGTRGSCRICREGGGAREGDGGDGDGFFIPELSSHASPWASRRDGCWTGATWKRRRHVSRALFLAESQIARGERAV